MIEPITGKKRTINRKIVFIIGLLNLDLVISSIAQTHIVSPAKINTKIILLSISSSLNCVERLV